MKPAKYIADHLRQVLINGASAPHTAEVQRFFKEEIKSRGWYTGEIRKLARRFEKVLKGDAGLEYLVAVADDLFNGDVLEEKVLAVFLLERSVAEFTPKHFKLFENWLDRVSSWADHDGLVQYLIGPMIAAEESRVANAFRWAKSRDRWHRRAAAVSLIRATRECRYFDHVERMTAELLSDDDDMVQKGLGWLLRETAKYDAKRTIKLLMKIRTHTPRLVLRTACETLSPAIREQVLADSSGTQAKTKRRPVSQKHSTSALKHHKVIANSPRLCLKIVHSVLSTPSFC
jgi:3-methyladenine DNA glycosylase AlkD